MTTRALNILAYNGIGKPAAYSCYDLPYSQIIGSATGPTAPSGSPAKLKVQVVSTTLADYDGLTINLDILLIDGLDSVTFTFDDDAAPPSTLTAINIMGLTTVVQIAAQMAISFELAGFRVVNKGAGLLWVYQPIGGDEGNTVTNFSNSLAQEIAVNDIINDTTVNAKFYNGASIDIPLLWGPKRGLGSSTPDPVQFVEAPA